MACPPSGQLDGPVFLSTIDTGEDVPLRMAVFGVCMETDVIDLNVDTDC